MATTKTLGSHLSERGLSRRSFLKYCSVIASQLALPPSAVPALLERLQEADRPPVIWLSFQECTGCTESFTRSHAPTIEDLIFNYISLDYQHTLQAASGEAAEAARVETMERFQGRYLLVVDGAVPTGGGGHFSTIAGRTNLDMLEECAKGAAAIIAIGTCAAFGGLPAAAPNPTGATGVANLVEQGLVAKKPLVNVPGCPPLPMAISGVLAHYLAFGRFPELDELGRPLSFYGETVHERCSRHHFYTEEKFARSFDDEGAREGWCLYKLGCKGPVTHSACAVYKWNQGTSFPIGSGHPCIGCTEPAFWDRGGFYRSLEDVVPVAASSANNAQASQEGRLLYEDNCIYCHSDDPTQFSTPAERIPELLRSGEVRSHQRLDFSQEQLDALEDYLKSSK